MEKSCRLWSPVVYAELSEPRTWKGEFFYTLEETPGRMDEIKIKPRRCSARLQGKHVEVEIACEILTLLESPHGQMRLFTRGENLRERIARDAFSAWPENPECEFVVNLHRLSWDGELKGREIHLNIIIFYSVMIIRNEVVKVPLESTNEVVIVPEDAQDLLNQLQGEIIQAEAAKMELKRRIHIYERDIQSLKRGIYRAQIRNLDLNEELSRNRKIIEELSGSLKDKERSRERRLPKHSGQRQDIPIWPQESEESLKLGGLIKRLFQNNA